jgi:hypothetical protein
VTPAEARAEAHRILAERRFNGTSIPRPLHGVLHWIGRHLHFLERLWTWSANLVGGRDVLWSIVGAVIVAVAAWVLARLARRRGRADRVAAARAAAEHGMDPDELERLAVEAEHRGDLEIALRLRFRAGLLRLAQARVLPGRPSLRTFEARRVLRNPRFDRLARDFDEVVYGRRPARAEDLAAAREEWPHVLGDAR